MATKPVTFGEYARAGRARSGLSLRQLQSRFDGSPTRNMIDLWEKGAYEPPRDAELIRRWARAIDVDVVTMLALAGVPTNEWTAAEVKRAGIHPQHAGRLDPADSLQRELKLMKQGKFARRSSKTCYPQPALGQRELAFAVGL